MENYRDKITSYFDEVAPVYGTKHGADMPGGQYGFGELYRQILTPYIKQGMKVLELGCGNGASSEMLSQFGIELVATDISSKMLEVASRRGIGNVKFRQLDAMKISESADLGQFDIVITFNCFSYLPDKAKAMRDFRSFIRKNGRLIILDMNPLCPVYPISALIRRNEMREWWNKIREMSPGNLRETVEGQGFRVEEIRTLNFVPHATEGPVFRFLKAANPFLNASPILNRFAMRVFLVAKPL